MSRVLRPAAARRLSIQALVVCLGAVAAAVVAFVQGSWLGLVWLLMAGLTSNLAWYYHRRSRPVPPDAPALDAQNPDAQAPVSEAPAAHGTPSAGRDG